MCVCGLWKRIFAESAVIDIRLVNIENISGVSIKAKWVHSQGKTIKLCRLADRLLSNPVQPSILFIGQQQIVNNQIRHHKTLPLIMLTECVFEFE